MMAYDGQNSGALFKNDRKETANHPDYTGSITIEGVEYWLSSWIKPMKNDASQRYMSIAVRRKEEHRPQQPPARGNTPQRPAQRGGSGFDDMDSDIPFN